MLTRDAEGNEAREHEERTQRDRSDVEHGAAAEQVPAEGWVP